VTIKHHCCNKDCKAEVERLRMQLSTAKGMGSFDRDYGKKMEAENERLRDQLVLARQSVEENGQAYENASDEVEQLRAENQSLQEGAVAYLSGETQARLREALEEVQALRAWEIEARHLLEERNIARNERSKAEAEVERLKLRSGRLRKAVNWLRGTG